MWGDLVSYKGRIDDDNVEATAGQIFVLSSLAGRRRCREEGQFSGCAEIVKEIAGVRLPLAVELCVEYILDMNKDASKSHHLN
jgi:hypothetical protein